MKALTTALIAAGALALSACGGGETNVAANNTVEEVTNLGTEDLGNDAGLANEAVANEAAPADANAVDANASTNATNTQ
jgi:hypothetical protein